MILQEQHPPERVMYPIYETIFSAMENSFNRQKLAELNKILTDRTNQVIDDSVAKTRIEALGMQAVLPKKFAPGGAEAPVNYRIIFREEFAQKLATYLES